VRAIQQLLRQLEPYFAPFAHVDIHVSSVDGYQGREADVVVFSATRSNAEGALGFVRDARRLNVAITRPRSGLVMIGSPFMLVQSEHWAKCARVGGPARVCSRFRAAGPVSPRTHGPLQPLPSAFIPRPPCRWIEWCRKFAAEVAPEWLPAAPWTPDEQMVGLRGDAGDFDP